jgi:hypothetical protein
MRISHLDVATRVGPDHRQQRAAARLSTLQGDR